MSQGQNIETEARKEFEKAVNINGAEFSEAFSLWMRDGKIDFKLTSQWMLFFRAWVKSRNAALIDFATKAQRG